jgi:homoserine kinase type II
MVLMLNEFTKIVENYDLGKLKTINGPGGTTGSAFRIETDKGKFFVKRRLSATVNPDNLLYNQALRAFLVDHGFPASKPLYNRENNSLVEKGGYIYELGSLLDGNIIWNPNVHQIYESGKFLAMYHSICNNFSHSGKKEFIKEDHLDNLLPIIQTLKITFHNIKEQDELIRIENFLRTLNLRIESKKYSKQKQSVLHGDYHPGNCFFTGNRITGLFDFDYAAPGPILRDILDGLSFFASERDHQGNCDTIWSLTGKWRFNDASGSAFLSGYLHTNPTSLHLNSAADFLLSRWFQMRLRGTRKIEEKNKFKFLMSQLWEMTDYIINIFPGWFERVLNSIESK